ncbi:MAG: peptidase S1, partial [Burkholderiaceae bacterium]|nr:peptidase S1 [Burkholderiaceae bacterium]
MTVEPVAAPAAEPAANATPPVAPAEPVGYTVSRRHLRTLWAVVLLLTALLIASLWQHQRPAARKITQEDIDAAVLRT